MHCSAIKVAATGKAYVLDHLIDLTTVTCAVFQYNLLSLPGLQTMQNTEER